MASDTVWIFFGAIALNFLLIYRYQKFIGSIVFFILGIYSFQLLTGTALMLGWVMTVIGLASTIFTGIQRLNGGS